MTLQELVERLQSHPVYQAGRAADVEIHVDFGLFPLATRHIRDVRWAAHEGTEYIVLSVTGQRAGPMTGETFGRTILGGGGHPV